MVDLKLLFFGELVLYSHRLFRMTVRDEVNDLSSVMRDMIAYSAIDEGTRVIPRW